jgi:hypothetical protein
MLKKCPFLNFGVLSSESWLSPMVGKDVSFIQELKHSDRSHLLGNLVNQEVMAFSR